MQLTGAVEPAIGISPHTSDDVSLELATDAGSVFSSTLAHPGSDSFWRRTKAPRLFDYRDGSGSAGGLTSLRLKSRRGPLVVRAKGRGSNLRSLDVPSMNATLRVGEQCFAASLRCGRRGRSLLCAP